MSCIEEPLVIEPPFTKIAEGLLGAEGPVFDRKCQFFMVAPLVKDSDGRNAGQVLSIDLDNEEVLVVCKPRDGEHGGIPAGCQCDKVQVVCKPRDGEHGGIPAGCQCDRDNNIWIADMRLGILKMDTTGNYQQMFKTDRDGRTMQGCNDCIFDYDGNLWVTAPAGDIAPAESRNSLKEPFGSVYCVTADTKDLIRIDGDLRFPNGIAVLHDSSNRPKTLIVAETPTKTLWQYGILGPGKVGKRSVWGRCPGDGMHGPDGMDFDEHDNLIVAHHNFEHLEVFRPTGSSPFLRIKCPFIKPSNVHFKPGTNTVYVTEHTNNALWTFEWRHKGKKQYCDFD